MLWKNDKLCRWSRVSDCPFSSLEQFSALITRYILFTYSIDNGINPFMTEAVNIEKRRFGFCLRVESGDAMVNDTKVAEDRNASRFTTSSEHCPKRLFILFHDQNFFPILFHFRQSYFKINLFNWVRKPAFPFTRQSFTNGKCIPSQILSSLYTASLIFILSGKIK